MTANTTDMYPDDVRSTVDDELDLSVYFFILLKWWKEIVIVAILAGGIAFAGVTYINRTSTPIYSANADILIMRMLTSFDLDERVRTSFADRPDLNSWRASLSQLSDSLVVAEAVVAELGDTLPPELRSPEHLVGLVSASVPLSADERYASNIIRLTVETDSAALSSVIANSWAKHYVDYVNGLYGEVPEAMIDGVASEHESANLAYQEAENAYQAFLANNQIDVLTRQSNENAAVRGELMVNYTRMLSSVISLEYNAHLDLYNKALTGPSEQAIALITSQVRGNVSSLDALYSLRTTAMSQLYQARNMERVLLDGGEASAKTNVAALQLLKLYSLSALQGYGSLPSSISLDGLSTGVTMTLDEQLSDVRALIAVLQTYVEQLNSEIQQLSSSAMIGDELGIAGGSPTALTSPVLSPDLASSTPISNVVDAFMQLVDDGGMLYHTAIDIDAATEDEYELLLGKLEANYRSLQAQLAAERSAERQLLHNRDMAWTTYETMGSKLQELRLLRAAANSEVRLGNIAMVPVSPQPRMSATIPTTFATLIGFVVAVILVLIVNSLGVSPILSRRTA